MEEDRLKGNLFENTMIAEYQKRNHHLYLHEGIHFWQDSNGLEVDLLTKKAQGFNVFEIKATKTILSNLFKNMDRFEEISSPASVSKTLIYGGDENEKRSKYAIISWKNIADQ